MGWRLAIYTAMRGLNMTTYELPKAALAAHLVVAAKKDERAAYLNAVYVDTSTGHLVSTDGCIMLVTRHDTLKGGGPSLILQRDVLAQALKKVPRTSDVLPMDVDAGRLTYRPLPGITFGDTAMGYTYPQWQRVIPASVDGQPGHYDPALVARIGDALQLLGGLRTQQPVRIFQNGPDRGAWAMLDTGHCDVPHVAVIMPLRNKMPQSDAAARVAALVAP
jgi:hypothetical protein